MAAWLTQPREERVRVVEALIAEKCTASGIAAKLGVSRNSVLGFCHRNGIRFGSPGGSDGYAHKRPKNDRSVAGGHATRTKAAVTLAGGSAVGSRQSAVGGVESRPAVEREPRGMVDADIGRAGKPSPLPTADCRLPEGGIGFFDLTDRHCKWPLWGDGPAPPVAEMRFCGAPARDGSSWCRACARRLTAPTPGLMRRRAA